MHAIGVNIDPVVVSMETEDRTHRHAIREPAPGAILGNDVRHCSPSAVRREPAVRDASIASIDLCDLNEVVEVSDAALKGHAGITPHGLFETVSLGPPEIPPRGA
jgi:hypothetical protein